MVCPRGQLHPRLPGFCVLARRSGAAIVPLTIAGAFAAMPRGSGFPRPKPIRLTFGRPITAEQCAAMIGDQLVALVDQRIRELTQVTEI